MSFWTESHEGNRTIVTSWHGGDLLLMTFIVGMLCALSVFNKLIPLSFMAVGLALFLVAKLSVIRRGVLVSWGPRLMSDHYAIAYKAGYVLMALGAALSLAYVVEALQTLRG